MIIIIEGPDGAGKTMLAQQINKQSRYPLVHRSKPETPEEKTKMMEEYLQAVKGNRNIIMDRCWYSEMVYGSVMRDQAYITFPQMYELERQLSHNGAIIIYCTGPKNVLWDRCKRRGEKYITAKEDFDAICDAYDALFASPHHIPVLRYEYKDL